jgi:hypothetical protein
MPSCAPSRCAAELGRETFSTSARRASQGQVFSRLPLRVRSRPQNPPPPVQSPIQSSTSRRPTSRNPSGPLHYIRGEKFGLGSFPKESQPDSLFSVTSSVRFAKKFPTRARLRVVVRGSRWKMESRNSGVFKRQSLSTASSRTPNPKSAIAPSSMLLLRSRPRHAAGR